METSHKHKWIDRLKGYNRCPFDVDHSQKATDTNEWHQNIYKMQLAMAIL